MQQQADQQSVQSEQQIAQAANVLEGGRVQNEQHRTAVESTVKLHAIKQQGDANLSSAKVELAKTAMQLQTERQLNVQANAVADRKHRREMVQRQQQPPPVQAPGRAANGHQFDQS
jgi:hypothetical protein